jgi:uncharacterized protein (DUF1697 family)
MKTIKSALLGAKTLTDTTEAALLAELKDLLKEHRGLIINRLIKDLPTYLDYKFNVKTTKQLNETVKQKLVDLKHDAVDLDQYKTVTNQVLARAVTHLTNEPFYVEIDAYLAPSVKPRELKFA